MADKLFPEKEKKDDDGEKEVKNEDKAGYSYARNKSKEVEKSGIVTENLSNIGLDLPNFSVETWLNQDLKLPFIGETDRELGLVLVVEFMLLLYLGLSLLGFLPFF